MNTLHILHLFVVLFISFILLEVIIYYLSVYTEYTLKLYHLLLIFVFVYVPIILSIFLYVMDYVAFTVFYLIIIIIIILYIFSTLPM